MKDDSLTIVGLAIGISTLIYVVATPGEQPLWSVVGGLLIGFNGFNLFFGRG